jgi:hypothetical protein
VDYLIGDHVTLPGDKDNQDDWSPPITYFQVATSYNPGKDILPVGDSTLRFDNLN